MVAEKSASAGRKGVPIGRLFFYVALAVIALVTFYPLFTTGFATADDLLYYLAARRGVHAGDLERMAGNSGRFYLYLSAPFYFLPYLVDHPFIIKLFHFIPLVLCLLVFARLASGHSRPGPEFWLFILFFLVTMQVSKHTSLFVAYPFYFTFSLLLLLLSFYFLVDYYRHSRRKSMRWSALFFAAGILFYEAYLMYGIFAALVIVHGNREGSGRIRWRRMIADAAPFVVISVVYLALYVGFRAYHPSPYAGSTIAAGKITIPSFFRVIWRLSLTAWPMTVFETGRTFFGERSMLPAGHSPVVIRLLAGAQVAWLVKGLLACWCGYVLMKALPPLNRRSLAVRTVTAFLLVFLPNVPLALTEKYTFYVEHGAMIGYVTTFFSFFGVILLSVTWTTWLVSVLSFSPMLKNAFIAVFLLCLFVCSVLTDYSNDMVAGDLRSANLRLAALDEACRQGMLNSIPPGTVVYGASLWSNPSEAASTLTEEGFDWGAYLSVRGQGDLRVFREEQGAVKASRMAKGVPWYLAAAQAVKSPELLLVAAPLTPAAVSDSAFSLVSSRMLVGYFAHCREFTVSFRTVAPATGKTIPVKVNHIAAEIPSGEFLRVHMSNPEKGERLTWFLLETPGIDLASVMVTDMVERTGR